MAIPSDAFDQASQSTHELSRGSGQVNPASDVNARMAAADQSIARIMHDIDAQGRYVDVASGPGTQAWNPALYAKSVARMGSALGTTGLALFAAEQLGLFLLNDHGKVWNPLTIAPPPIVQNFIPAALDALTGTPRLLTGYDDSRGGLGSDFYSRNHGPDGEDMHLAIAKGEYNAVRIVHYPPFLETAIGVGRVGPTTGILGDRMIGAASQDTALVDDPNFGTDGTFGEPIVPAALELRNKYFPSSDFNGPQSNMQGQPYEDFATATVDQLVDDVLDAKNDTKHMGIKPGQVDDLLRYHYRQDEAGPGKLVRMFIGGSRAERTGEFRPDREEKTTVMRMLPLAKSAFPGGIIPAKFRNENSLGFVTHVRGKSPTDKIHDDEAYVPLSFTDLRPAPGNVYRTVYFRPFIKSLRERFSPEWNKQQFFGRTDAVASYMSTGRSVSLGFDVVAFGPEDLETIYQKLNWLSSMTMPKYDKDLLFVSGPIVRLRVGDVINALGPEGARGLPGIIEDLEFSYDESIWELKKDWKVPRNINVTLSFTVLHDRPIGVGAEGKFGALGTIDPSSGRFIPPGLTQNPGPGAGDNDQFPEVSDGLDAFRTIGGTHRNSMNEYKRMVDSENNQNEDD